MTDHEKKQAAANAAEAAAINADAAAEAAYEAGNEAWVSKCHAVEEEDEDGDPAALYYAGAVAAFGAAKDSHQDAANAAAIAAAAFGAALDIYRAVDAYHIPYPVDDPRWPVLYRVAAAAAAKERKQ